MEILQTTPSVQVNSLTKMLYASEATVRRDLKKLEEKGLIVRTRGKAVNVNVYADKTVAFHNRESLASPVKKRIAEAAIASCVSDGDVVMLDASSTAAEAVEFLKEKKDVIVITSGLKAMLLLSQTQIKFYSTGGKAINSSYSFVGQTAIETLKSFNADVRFVSCHGVSENGYATDTSERENDVRERILKQSKRKVLLVASGKIGKNCYHNLCHLSAFDDVFCDAPLPSELLRSVKNFHLV